MYYYQHHIGDFIKDTSHLTNEQVAVYLKMIWRYYECEKPFTDSAEDIAFAMRSDEKTVQLLLRHFFVQQDDGWHQARCDKEIQSYHSKSEKAANSANARWKNAHAMRPHSERNADATVLDANQEPRTKNHINTVSPPDGVSIKVWADFLKHRKQMKAPITETAMAGIRREAEKAGFSLEQALVTSMERSWRSFKAEWITDKPAAPNIMRGVI